MRQLCKNNYVVIAVSAIVLLKIATVALSMWNSLNQIVHYAVLYTLFPC